MGACTRPALIGANRHIEEETTVKISQPSNGYFNAGNVTRPMVLTIESVTGEDNFGKGQEFIIKFANELRRLVLNATNTTACLALFGEESDDWHGQQVELYVAATEYNGTPTTGVRLRKPSSDAIPATSASATPKPMSKVPVAMPKVPVPIRKVPVPMPKVPVPTLPPSQAPSKLPKRKRLKPVTVATSRMQTITAPPADYPEEA